MAESARSPSTTATVSPAGPEIKQEMASLENFGFSMSPEIAMKRPLETTAQTDPEAKRVKTENEPGEGSVEDNLAMLIQNTLANINDLVGHSNGGPDDTADAGDPMDVESMPPPEPTPAPPAPVTFSSDPEKYIQRTNVHALGNLAISLLLTLSQRPIEETSKWLHETESSHSKLLRRLRAAFDATRDLYSTEPILVVDPMDMSEPDTHTVIELANLAKLGTWLIDGDANSLATADDHFLAVFPSLLSDLPGEISELYLAIKTQRAVEGLLAKEPEKPSTEVIVETLTNGLEEKLQARPAGDQVPLADQTFVSSVQSRQQALQEDTQAQVDQASLTTKYPQTDLLRYFTIHVKQRLASIAGLGDRLGVPIPPLEDLAEPEVESLVDGTGDDMIDLDDLSSFFEKTTSGLVQNALAGLTDEDPAPAVTIEGEEAAAEASNATPNPDEAAPQPQPNGKIDFMTDYKELEALVAESTADYVKTTLNGLSPVPYQPTVPASTAESMAAQSPYLNHLHQHQPQNSYYSYSQPVPEHQPPQPGPGGILPPNQSLSSALLYDKARQAALSKSSAHTRREGLHSTRRPWTQEEEKALMAGLDMVKGPHWSQILTLFGQNGTISDILKERTQVQLKDKARNLKLFFLKTNSEMPYYLQAVTGELKTRAPTQAARKEAEERARMNSEEDQAKLQGIMALAGGLQHPPQNRASGSPVTPMSSSVVTPAHAASVAAQGSSSGQHTPGMQTSTAHTPSAAPTGTQAASLAQSKTFTPAAAQQALQAISQALPRAQNQLPPHLIRPQTQQQHPGLQRSPQNQPAAQPQPSTAAHHPQATAAAQQPTAPHANGVAQAQAQPTQQTVPSPAPAQPAQQPVAPQNSAAQQTPPTQASHQPSGASPPESESHDNSAEAALLKGLQAAVAEATS